MKKVYIPIVKPVAEQSAKRVFNLLAAIIFLLSAKLNAQCGVPPTALSGTVQCNGMQVSTTILPGLLGGPYNIQAYIDYMNPGIPFAPYVTNYAGSNYVISGQTAGTYTVYIVDIAHGNCYDSAVYTITQPAILNFANGFGSPATCAGMVQASFTMAGGTPPYSITYTNDSVNFFSLTTTSATSYSTTLNIGAYAWKLTDANGCIVDQTGTVFGFSGTDQAHWYVGICGVTDSAVSYLTGGNQTFSRNVNVLMQGLGNFRDSMVLVADYGDGSAVQSFSKRVCNESVPIVINHTYSTQGVYKVIYSAYSFGIPGSSVTPTDTSIVIEFINNNSDVWPGDANGDGIANNVDLLNVGIAFGTTDVMRAGASSSWTGQFCADWALSFITGLNYKHADCDGDGTVGYADTNAISANYNQTHVLKLAQNVQASVTDPTLTVNFPTGAYPMGSPVTIPISLGSSSVPATNFYGIAFTVNYPTNAFDGNSMDVDFTNSFMGMVGTNTVEIHKNFAANGSIDVAVSLTNHINMTGFGNVCELNAITIDNVSGKMNTTITEYITISNVTFIDKDGNPIAINTQKDSITINTAAGLNESKDQSSLKLYPNPAKEMINLVSIVTIEEVQIMDLTGRIVLKAKPGTTTTQLTTENLERGFYIARIKTAKGVEDRRIEVQK
ncbi:MAG: T9SS type A sorting domain-containing protein [Bacteroidia bacterium]|nr:T9SS type A sorting domain-containing protein [Bacteroidia bacterium]